MINMDIKIGDILSREEGEHLFQIREAMTHTMSQGFGILREKQEMQEGLQEIKKLQKQLPRVSLQTVSVNSTRPW